MTATVANQIRIHRTGGPEVLAWESAEIPDPGPGEVRLRHAAVGLNFIDVYHRTGYYPLPLPLTPGVEGAGTVEAVGAGVEHVAVGDRVAYAGPIGAYAEVRLIAADRLVQLPDGVDLEDAAAVTLKGLTAHMLLRRTYRVEPGDTILVHAAAGGVGLLVCQWAADIGATVIGTVSTAAKAELARSHGCHHPITGEQDFVAEVDRLTGGAKLPVVYDSVGKDTFLRSLDCLRPRGMMVSFGQSSGPVEPIAPVLLSQKGALYLTRPTLFAYIASRAELEAASVELFAMVASNKLKVEINQRFALRDAAEAHRALESRATTGSTVLTV
ncbi:MAG TPA: quinone oxidoreductase [Sphingomicrobium sp.]|nr:quinone oxidoreductase [Sphingomicrobium sp.]